MAENVNNVENVDVAPVPTTVDYGVTLRLLPKFKSDVTAALSEYAYVETHELIKFVDHNETAPINTVNELVRRISMFPYRGVASVMHVLETDQSQYFEVVDNTETKE